MAEFFAGIGLFRAALEPLGSTVVFANDNRHFKRVIYAANFGAEELCGSDIRDIAGGDVPDVELATASFPCTDLSVAGKGRGLNGDASRLFWEFSRILTEMGQRRPRQVLLENVPGLVGSHGGNDLEALIVELNGLGYTCDLAVIDARHFVPQSRKRLFILGTLGIDSGRGEWCPSAVRSPAVCSFVNERPHLEMNAGALQQPPITRHVLSDLVDEDANDWWDQTALEAFVDSLIGAQKDRLQAMLESAETVWASAYRRNRNGRSRWEIRGDQVSGCLRAVTGGSSRQALLRVTDGSASVRWMNPKEYARLQGVPGFRIPAEVSTSQALYGFGDALCVPAVQWVASQWIADGEATSI